MTTDLLALFLSALLMLPVGIIGALLLLVAVTRLTTADFGHSPYQPMKILTGKAKAKSGNAERSHETQAAA